MIHIELLKWLWFCFHWLWFWIHWWYSRRVLSWPGPLECLWVTCMSIQVLPHLGCIEPQYLDSELDRFSQMGNIDKNQALSTQKVNRVGWVHTPVLWNIKSSRIKLNMAWKEKETEIQFFKSEILAKGVRLYARSHPDACSQHFFCHAVTFCQVTTCRYLWAGILKTNLCTVSDSD